MKPLIAFTSINKTKKEINKVFAEYEGLSASFRATDLSINTKKILQRMTKDDLQGRDLKKLALKLDDDFYDQVFDHFHKLKNEEQNKILDLLEVYRKRSFKNKIYQNVLLYPNNENAKKLALFLSDSYKPKVLQLSILTFNHILFQQDSIHQIFQPEQSSDLFDYIKKIDPTLHSPLAVSLVKRLLSGSSKNDLLAVKKKVLPEFLINHYVDEEGARFGLHYLKVLPKKSYENEVLRFIIKCKDNIRNKKKALASSIDDLLYDIYLLALEDRRFDDIIDDLTMTLTDKIISEAFGDDERSQFWKRYSRSIVEPIVFVRQPVEMFMMKFDDIGIVEYIDTGNATYLYEDEDYSEIKNQVLTSSRNRRDILNIYSLKTVTGMKAITKTKYDYYDRYIHRGYWMGQFKLDMKRIHGVIEE